MTNTLSGMPDKRVRRSAAEVESLRQSILDIVADCDQLTIRHLFYLMVGRGVIEKTEVEYNNVVVRLALQLRRSGDIPFGKIVDGSRLYRVPRTYGSITEALEDAARLYRRDYWRGAGQLIEVWCEKDAISGFLFDVTAPLGIPLMVTRGFSSESIVQAIAEEARVDRRPLTILFVSDLDPSGDLMPADVIRRIRFYAPEAEVHLRRVAVTREQATTLALPTRPTKRDRNHHASNFEGESVEVDAMPPAVLKNLLTEAIEQFMDSDQLRILREAEASEREQLRIFARRAA